MPLSVTTFALRSGYKCLIPRDSLVGWQPPGKAEVAVVRRAYALSDVRTVSVKKFTMSPRKFSMRSRWNA